MRFATTLIMMFSLLLTVGLAQNGAVLNAGLDVDAGTMDPRLARDTSAARMQELLFNGLVSLSPTLEPQPELASSWAFTSPTTLVFELRPDVTFHNGEPFLPRRMLSTLLLHFLMKNSGPPGARFTHL